MDPNAIRSIDANLVPLGFHRMEQCRYFRIEFTMVPILVLYIHRKHANPKLTFSLGFFGKSLCFIFSLLFVMHTNIHTECVFFSFQRRSLHLIASRFLAVCLSFSCTLLSIFSVDVKSSPTITMAMGAARKCHAVQSTRIQSICWKIKNLSADIRVHTQEIERERTGKNDREIWTISAQVGILRYFISLCLVFFFWLHT